MDTSLQKLKVEEFSKKLGYTFKQPELLLQAFCHSSYVNEQTDFILQDNERLEFLGDAVLDLAISHILMETFQKAEEGVLSKFRAMVVDETGLYEVAASLQLGDCLLLGKGEEQSSGREKTSILANTVEAILGALYLDAGFVKTMEIIRILFSSLLEKVGSQEIIHDFKSLLQEYTQRTYKALPQYNLIKESGLPHNKVFNIELTINEKVLSRGEGKCKKEAEQNAAREAFFCLQKSLNL